MFDSLRTADVSPRSSPLRDVSQTSANSAGDERGETSVVRRLGVGKWRTRKRATIFLISRAKPTGKASAFRSGVKNVPFLRFIFLRMHFILFLKRYLIRMAETMRNEPWKSAGLVELLLFAGGDGKTMSIKRKHIYMVVCIKEVLR